MYRYRLIIDRPVYCNYFGGKWRILISSRGDRVRFSSAFGRVAVEKNADRRVSKLSLSGKKRVDRRGNEQREWHEATRANSWIVCKTTAAPPRHRFHTRRLICAFRELLPFFPPSPFFPFNRGKNNVEYPKNFPPRLFPSFRFCKTYSLNDLEAECTSHTFDRVPLPGFEFFFRGNSNLSNQLFELRLEYIYTRVVKFYFSAYECQGNRHFVHWGGRNRGWGGEARSLKRFFPTSRVALRYWNGPTASSVGGMALVRTQHVLYAASHSRRGKEGKKRETKKRKEGKGRKGVGSPLVSGCWWTLLHFIPCFPPWLRASWILYDRHSPHHRLFCLLLSNNTRPRPIYVKCTVLRNILFVSHNNLYPRFFFFSFYLDKISHVSIREFRVFQIQSRYRDCY